MTAPLQDLGVESWWTSLAAAQQRGSHWLHSAVRSKSNMAAGSCQACLQLRNRLGLCRARRRRLLRRLAARHLARAAAAAGRLRAEQAVQQDACGHADVQAVNHAVPARLPAAVDLRGHKHRWRAARVAAGVLHACLAACLPAGVW